MFLKKKYFHHLLSGFPSAIGTSVIATIMVSFQKKKEHTHIYFIIPENFQY